MSRKSRQHREQSLNEELRFHLDELAEANRRAGMSDEEARRQAAIDLGGSEQVREECRDVHRVATLENLWANLKQAVRLLRNSPSFSLTVIVTLALAIGANTAVFSAVDAILLRPLPFPHGDRLVLFHQIDRTSRNPESHVSTARIEDWNRLNSTFQAISGYYTDDATVLSGTLPEKATLGLVAPRFLQVWGIAPMLGRDFTPQEEHFGGPAAVILSYRLWERLYRRDAHIIGKPLRLGQSFFTVVGVMPFSFAPPDKSIELWAPNPVDAPYSRDRASTWFTVVGRLKPGVSIEQASANLRTVQGQLGWQFPKTDRNLDVRLESLKESAVGGERSSLALLFGSVSLLLLIACTNIAALLLARTTQREREISIRYSLGASRASVIAQLLTESFLLAFLGSMAGLALAAGASKVFQTLARSLPRVDEITLNWRILVYSLACGVISTLLFGLIPAWQGSRRNMSDGLARHSRSQVSAKASLQWILVGTQTALAVTLLIGAGLLLRTFQELGRVRPGYDASHVLTFRITGSWGETADLKALNQTVERILAALRATPGVEAAADSAFIPGSSDKYPQEYKLLDGETDSNRKILPDTRYVSPGYFAALHIPVLAGKACSEANWSTAVVNRSFVESYLNGSPAIGRHIQVLQAPFNAQRPPAIIGVVGDARESGINQEPVPTVYNCGNTFDPNRVYVVRTLADPRRMAAAIRQAILKIEPQRSVYDLTPLSETLSDSLAANRFRTWLLTLFALTAISLACVGIYGTLSYFVSLRNREVGLRIALGAVPNQILRRFLSQGLGVATLGCVAGLMLAAALSRLLTGMLYEVETLDGPTYLVVAILVLTVAALSSFLPAARAARLDPMRVLREE